MQTWHAKPLQPSTASGSHPDRVAGELIWNLYGIDTIRRKLVDLITGATKEVRLVAHPGVVSGDVRDTPHGHGQPGGN